MNDNPLDMLWVILVLALVFYMAWLVTRFIAVRSKGRAAGRFMRVVDRLNISNDKAILIVSIGAEYCVIGVTGHEMRLLKTLDEAEAEAFDEQTGKQGPARPEGSAAGVWQGMQTFSERMGFALKRPGAQPRPQDTARPNIHVEDDQSVIDMMNERIKIRKETKHR